MTRLIRTGFTVAVIAVSVALSGCVIVAPTTSTPAAPPSKTATVDYEAVRQKMNDEVACSGLDIAMTKHNRAVKPGSSAVDWVTAYKDFALAVNDYAGKAGDGSEVQISLEHLTTVLAGRADRLSAGESTSTQQQLDYRNAIKAAGDACGVEYRFAD